MPPIHHAQIVTAWLPIRSTSMDRHEPNTQVVDECIEAFVCSLSRVLPLLAPEVSEVVVAEVLALITLSKYCEFLLVTSVFCQ